MIVLTIVAPTAKEVTTPAKNAGLPDDALSIEAKQAIKNIFSIIGWYTIICSHA